MTTLRRAVASAARQSFAGLKLSSAARTSIEAANALGRRRESNFMQEPPRPHRVPQQVHRQVVVERTRAVSAVVLPPRGKRQLRMLLSYLLCPHGRCDDVQDRSSRGHSRCLSDDSPRDVEHQTVRVGTRPRQLAECYSGTVGTGASGWDARAEWSMAMAA